jgi:hypothetical protein
MSFEFAVAVGGIVGLCASVAWFVLPASAIVSMVRRRRHRPAAPSWFALSTIGAWSLSLAYVASLFIGGGWYGENGPSAEIAALGAALLLGALLAVHVALYRLGNRPLAP